MNKGNDLNDYYKLLEAASVEELEEHKSNLLAALEDYKKVGDETKVIETQELLVKLGETMEKRRAK